MLVDNGANTRLVLSARLLVQEAALESLPRVDSIPVFLHDYLTDTLCVAGILFGSAPFNERRALNALRLDLTDAEDALSALVDSGKAVHDIPSGMIWAPELQEIRQQLYSAVALPA